MARDLVYRGRRIQVATDTAESPDGSTIRRDIVIHPGAVVILPLVDADHVCLLRNFRFVVDATLIELPAGTLEPGEAPELTAVRELAEETGYQAARWRKLGEFFASPGVMTELMHLYVAQGLTAGQAHPEHDEKLQPEIVAWEQAMRWATDGTIRDGKTLVGLFWWDRVREKG